MAGRRRWTTSRGGWAQRLPPSWPLVLIGQPGMDKPAMRARVDVVAEDTGASGIDRLPFHARCVLDAVLVQGVVDAAGIELRRRV